MNGARRAINLISRMVEQAEEVEKKCTPHSIHDIHTQNCDTFSFLQLFY